MSTSRLCSLSYQAFLRLFTYCKLSLQVFNASHNAIKHIESAFFTDFANLKYLDLSSNQIPLLSEKLFESMGLLRSIKLNNNSLASIDDGVFSEMKLKHLDLSCNQLTSDNFLWSNVDAEYLNLTLNEYKEINVSALENIVTDLWGEMLSIYLNKPH